MKGVGMGLQYHTTSINIRARIKGRENWNKDGILRLKCVLTDTAGNEHRAEYVVSNTAYCALVS